MTMSGLSTLSLALFAVVSAGGMEELSLSAPGAPPLSGDSCSRVQGMGVLIDVDTADDLAAVQARASALRSAQLLAAR